MPPCKKNMHHHTPRMIHHIVQLGAMSCQHPRSDHRGSSVLFPSIHTTRDWSSHSPIHSHKRTARAHRWISTKRATLAHPHHDNFPFPTCEGRRKCRVIPSPSGIVVTGSPHPPGSSSRILSTSCAGPLPSCLQTIQWGGGVHSLAHNKKKTRPKG
jgi:hypothetical protein